MKLKTAAMVVLFTLSTATVAAQSQELDRGPGAISPSSPLYGLETAMDNAAVDIGLAKASNIAQERAAEARKAAEKGNYRGAQKAANQMSKVAKRAKSNETQGLEKAESVLQGVMENAPEAAQQGLQTALQNVQRERERVERGGAAPESPGPGQPDGNQTPDDRPDGTNDTDGTPGNTTGGAPQEQPGGAP